MIVRGVLAAVSCAVLLGCSGQKLDEKPTPLGDFGLGFNFAQADNVQRVPISRTADPKDWEKAIQGAIENRFGEKRYQGPRLYNISLTVDAYALAPPGIPILAAPKSVVVVTAHIWDDAKALKLNAEGKQLMAFEGMSGDTVIGSGLTRSKKQQMDALAFNVAAKVEEWLLENPQWFGMESTKPATESVVTQAQNSAP